MYYSGYFQVSFSIRNKGKTSPLHFLAGKNGSKPSRKDRSSTKKKSLCILLWNKEFVSDFSSFLPRNGHRFCKMYIHFSGFPSIQNVCSYFQHRDKYSKTGRGDDFKSALKQCEEYLSDPVVIML